MSDIYDYYNAGMWVKTISSFSSQAENGCPLVWYMYYAELNLFVKQNLFKVLDKVDWYCYC